ncbi:MAG: DUF2304 domain-containing protein [Phycisphaerae bacterium]
MGCFWGNLLAQAATRPGETYQHGNRLVPLALAVIVFVVVVEMIRRRKLREEYALLWLGTSVVMLAVALFPDVVIEVAEALHINYLTVVVLGLFLFLAMIVMHFAVVISRQAEEIRQLAQRLALLDHSLEQERNQRWTGGEDKAGRQDGKTGGQEDTKTG